MINTQKSNTKTSPVTILVIIGAMLPVVLFILTQVFPPMNLAPKKEAKDETISRRTSAAERRAERAEARKARQAEKAATTASTTVQYSMPEPGMMAFPPMEPGMDFGAFPPNPGFDNSMAMAPGFGGGMGPGMGFGGGFGPGFGPGFGSF